MRWIPEGEEEEDKEEIGVKGAVLGRGSVNMKASLLAVNMMTVVVVNQSSAVWLGKLKVVVVVLFGGKGGLWKSEERWKIR